MQFKGSIYELDDSTCLIQSPTNRVLKIGLPVKRVVGHVSFLEVSGQADSPPLEPVNAEVLKSRLKEVGAFTDAEVQNSLSGLSFKLIGDEELLQLARPIFPMEEGASPAVSESTTEVRVLILRRYDERVISEFVSSCEMEEATSVSLVLESAETLWIGPLSVNGTPPNLVDVLGRRLMNASNLDVEMALRKSPSLDEMPRDRYQGVLEAGIPLMLDQLRQWRLSGRCGLQWAQIELRPSTATLKTHALLPLPHRPAQRPPRHLDIEATVDPTIGIVQTVYDIDHDPEVPRRLCTRQSRVGYVRRLYPWTNNVTCGGSSFDGVEPARLAAIGEALERYCGNIPRSDLPVQIDSFDGLVKKSLRPIDPETLVLYAPHQYADPTFPFKPFGRSTEAHWIPGTNITTGSTSWLPAAFCYVNWYKGANAGFPRFMDLAYPGIAAGSDYESAVVSGIQEVIERDATMVWWLNEGRVPGVELDAELKGLWADEACKDQEPWALEVPNEFRIPVVAGVLHNRRGPFLNVGFACKSNLSEATRKAWTEAITLQEGSRDLLAENSRHRSAVARRELSAKTVRAFRPSRDYLDDFEDNFKDVNDLMLQQTVYLDPRAISAVLPKLRPDPAAELSSQPVGRDLSSWKERVESRGYEIHVADLTTPDVAVTGVRVVRVIIPGLVCNAPAAYPPLGAGRIQDEAVQLGMVSKRKDFTELNYWPLPHA